MIRLTSGLPLSGMQNETRSQTERKNSSTLPEPSPDATDERLLLRSTILSAANKIYLDCCFDALRQEQNLWADILPDLA